MYGLSAGTKISDHCREVAIIERFKLEPMYRLSTGTKIIGCCREMAISGVLTV